jgi:hypothetical protein
LAQDPADARAEGAAMSSANLQDEINKRITLNLLIEGAAQHTSMTSHHLVSDELNAINRDLLLLYDQYELASIVQYWTTISKMVCGTPQRFWARATTDRAHPFFHHKLLARHGGTLAEITHQRAVERCVVKGVRLIPVVFSFQLSRVYLRILHREAKHQKTLVELAKACTEMAWGISRDRMHAALCGMTSKVEFGDLRTPGTFSGKVLRLLVVGYGGVMRDGEKLCVVASGRVWPVLSHELVKGTMELICLHGMTELDDETYPQVVSAADKLEYEPWLLQTGPELWRRLLGLMPQGVAVPEMVMHIARLPARSLEALMLAVIEKPDWAKELLAGLTAGRARGLSDDG